MLHPRRILPIFLLGALSVGAAIARADSQIVGLPYVLGDNIGSTWDVQQDGSIGDGGNDLYDGGGQLFVGQNLRYFSNQGQATFDPQANELTFPRTQMGGIWVSRRVAVIKPLACARFIEIIENPTAQSLRVNLRCYFNLGGSTQQVIPLTDPKRGKHPVGNAIFDGRNAIAMIGGSRTSKVLPQFQYAYNNDNVNLVYTIDVPPRQSVAVAHLQLRGQTAQQVADAWAAVREKDLLQNLPKDLTRKLVNWPSGEPLPMDLEVLRGGAQDVVELRGIDQYRGLLILQSIKLQTMFGPLDIPRDKIVCLFNVGKYRRTQLVLTTDGDLFGGRISEQSLDLQMGWGQVTKIPLAQISRIGFRGHGGEGDELTSTENKSLIFLRDGQRILIRPPGKALDFSTTIGNVSLPPSAVSAVVFQDPDQGVPDVRLVDGSRISALTAGAWLDFTAPGASGRALHVPVHTLSRVSLAPEQEIERLSPSLVLANKDLLVGTITGTLSLQTAFDTFHIEGPQIKRMARMETGKGGVNDVRITLWDDSQVSGRLNESDITVSLRCGVVLRVPVGLVDQYIQPLPLPSDRVVEMIVRTVADMDSDRFLEREAAQRKIEAIGPPAMSVLRRLRAKASTEVMGRMDVILQKLEQEVAAEAPSVGNVNGSPIWNVQQDGLQIFENRIQFQDVFICPR